MSEVYDKLVPDPAADTKPFWDALHEGKFRLQRCADCKKVRHYPRPVCDACFSMNAEWVEASGRGMVHSWTITHHAFHPGFKVDLPFMLLTVDLEEGVRMQAQARGIAEGDLKVGLKVKVGFERVKADLTLAVFEPG
ncbi:MAG: Zn-ribbon domain-containing OB-fold protein [Acetobacteraceae bacterium]|nr:Zn-ribbon domain-containing OB-fold protein [Acetobacteraceae bacterium]